MTSKKELIKKIKQNPELIKTIPQTEELCIAAIQSDSHALQYVKTQTPKICAVAVKKNGDTLKFVKNKTKELCLLSLETFFEAAEHFPSDLPIEVYFQAVTVKPENFKYIPESKMTKEICAEFISDCPEKVKFVPKKFLNKEMGKMILSAYYDLYPDECLMAVTNPTEPFYHDYDTMQVLKDCGFKLGLGAALIETGIVTVEKGSPLDKKLKEEKAKEAEKKKKEELKRKEIKAKAIEKKKAAVSQTKETSNFWNDLMK